MRRYCTAGCRQALEILFNSRPSLPNSDSLYSDNRSVFLHNIICKALDRDLAYTCKLLQFMLSTSSMMILGKIAHSNVTTALQ